MLVLLLLTLNFAFGSEVSPEVTGAFIRKVKGNHLFYESQTPNGLTLITIGGTNSSPQEFKNVHQWALNLGYRVLALDYENEVISTLCWNVSDFSCFDTYREEIVFGKPVSDLVKVDFNNSILNRLEKLLSYLKWDIDWHKVVLVGHSQGAGHVAYLAKFLPVAKVIMTGGPHDFIKVRGSASWTHKPSQAKFLTFIHKNDFFGTESVLGVSESLGSEVTMTEIPFQDPHNSYNAEIFQNIWLGFLE